MEVQILEWFLTGLLLIRNILLKLTIDILMIYILQFVNCKTSAYLCSMERNNGMRPQDVAVLLKILLLKDQTWMKKDLAGALFISPAEIGHSLNRSQLAGLVGGDGKKVLKKSFLEFLIHGFPYVFPVRPGGVTIGIPTAHSAPALNKFIVSEEKIVWPYPHGKARGYAIAPLYKGAIEASLRDPDLYDLLSLCDVLRIGRIREKQKAKELIEARFEKGVVKSGK